MKKYIYVFLFLFACMCAQKPLLWAQQDPMFSQYMFNTLAVNPAYAGNRGVLSGTALHRNQWVGIAGAPITNTITIDTPIPFRRVGAGVSIIHDKLGITTTFGMNAYYSYQIRFGSYKKKGTVLSMGIQGGFRNYRMDLSEVNHSALPNTVDPSFMGALSLWLPNFGAGLFFNTNKMYIGVSVPNILNNSLSGDQVSSGFVSRSKQSRHLFVMAGYVFKVGEDVTLKPSTNFKLVEGAPMQWDLNANIWFFDLFGGGVSYRTGDSFVGMVELLPTKYLKIGYAYDFTLTELQKYNSGSHEIMIRYEMGLGRTKIITPRYF
jgi:type IX secretion system PorP/SprF family membrane protein